ncbi:MAG: hypothetical protein ACRD28_05970 [Acidobacteriaceae bacterium]
MDAADLAGTSQGEIAGGGNLFATAKLTEKAIVASPFMAMHGQNGAQSDASIHLNGRVEASLTGGPSSIPANGPANASSSGGISSNANSAGDANGSNQSIVSNEPDGPNGPNGSTGSNPSNASASSAATGGGDNNNGGQAASGNGTSTAVHDATKSGTAATATFTPNSASSKIGDGALPSSTPQGTGTPHGNSSDSVAGIHGASSAFLVSNRTNAIGNSAAPNSNSGTAQGTSSDAFTALDSAATGQRGVLLHAAPNQVSVGVTDPSLGWVEVRAERVAGQVTAALAATSAASHAVLTSVLPSMATYLQQQHAGVQHVHVETGLSGGQSGAGSQGQPSSQRDASTSRDSMVTVNSGVNSASNAWVAAPAGTGAIAAAQETASILEGRRFSIRA